MFWSVAFACLAVAAALYGAALYRRLRSLKQVVRRCEAAERNLFFSRLFSGSCFESAEQLHGAARQAGVTFPFPSYVVAAIRIERWGTLPHGPTRTQALDFAYQALRETFEESFADHTVTEAVEYAGRLVCVLNLQTGGEEGAFLISRDVLKTVEQLEEQHELSVTAAISRTYEDPLQLSAAFRDTEKVFAYLAVIDEDRQVAMYEALSSRSLPQSAGRFMQLEARLLSCVQAMNFEGVRMVIHQMVTDEFENVKPSIETFSVKVFGMQNCLLNVMNEIRAVTGHGFFDSLDAPRRLLQAESLSDILEEADKLLDALEAYGRQQKQNAPVWLGQAAAYIKSAFRNPDLTVYFVADRFGVSPSYCSKLFKQFTGMGTFDYIQQLRLEEAKKLIASGKSLKETAGFVGFPSPLTMNRAFKRYEGVAARNFKTMPMEAGTDSILKPDGHKPQ